MKGKVLQYEQHYQHFPHNHRDVPLKSLETVRGCNANAKLIQATDERTALIMANDCLQSRWTTGPKSFFLLALPSLFITFGYVEVNLRCKPRRQEMTPSFYLHIPLYWNVALRTVERGRFFCGYDKMGCSSCFFHREPSKRKVFWSCTDNLKHEKVSKQSLDLPNLRHRRFVNGKLSVYIALRSSWNYPEQSTKRKTLTFKYVLVSLFGLFILHRWTFLDILIEASQDGKSLNDLDICRQVNTSIFEIWLSNCCASIDMSVSLMNRVCVGKHLLSSYDTDDSSYILES